MTSALVFKVRIDYRFLLVWACRASEGLANYAEEFIGLFAKTDSDKTRVYDVGGRFNARLSVGSFRAS